MFQSSAFFNTNSHKELLSDHGQNKNKSDIPKPWDIDPSTPLYAKVSDVSFDGKKVFRGSGIFTEKSTQALLINNLDNFKTNDYPIVVQEYTSYLGFKFPNKPSEFQDLPESYPLFLAKKGKLLSVKTENLNGHDALQIKIKSTYLLFPWQNPSRIFCFWLLPDLNYAIKQCDILREDNKLAYRIINDSFEKLPNKSIYLPRKTVLEYYTSEMPNAEISSTVLYKEIFSLVSVSTQKINTNQFTLQNLYSKPGTRIADHVLSDTDSGLQYDMPANPADLDRVIESELTGKDFTPTPLPSRAAMIIRWIIILIGLGMILYAGYRKFIQKT
ncbi:MAG: hypothetical protein LBJ67_13615 [Planctomycetaceae bacterium]|jgi:hypothetical protein|nr:hypothetical protein [Planctomycetaceae bacterium]